MGQQKKANQNFKQNFKQKFKIDSCLPHERFLNFISNENGAALLEVLFTFVAQLFLSLGVIILFTQIARAEIMSFQDWKKFKVDQAQAQAAQPSKTAEAAPAGPLQASSPNSNKNRAPKIEASKLALQIAQELSIEDYFALYLSQFHERSDFIDAAKKLSPSELGDLLLTLKSSLARETPSDSPQSLSFSTLTAPTAPIKK